MSLAAQRAAIVAILEGVPGIGVVHDYQRWAAQWADFLALFQDPTTQTVRGCTITREATAETWLTNAQVERRHTWVLTLMMALNDEAASEKTAQDLAEAVCDALRLDPALGGSAQGDSGPPQVRTFAPRLFGSVLCHVAEIAMITKEVVDV